ncbi:uncharacterized protein ACBT57_027178 isoform 1-T1 [Dama dama]
MAWSLWQCCGEWMVRHHATHFFHKGDCEEIAKKRTVRKRVVLSTPTEKIVSNDAKMPNEMTSETGSPDLTRNKKFIGHLGETDSAERWGRKLNLRFSNSSVDPFKTS